MPVITRSRKRQYANDNTTNDDAKSVHEPQAKKLKVSTKSNKKSDPQLVDLTEYYCCVCKELPLSKIFQCRRGCIICDDCYPKIRPCKCPLCRVEMIDSHPIRCLFAERTLALRSVRCRHSGCNQIIEYSQLKKHQTEQCEYLPIFCKFKLFGCDWKGLRYEKSEHEQNCQCDIHKCLAVATELHEKLQLYQTVTSPQANFSEIHCRTATIYKTRNGEFSNAFGPFYFAESEWEVEVRSKMVANSSNSYKIEVRLKGHEFPEEDLFHAPQVILEPIDQSSFCLEQNCTKIFSTRLNTAMSRRPCVTTEMWTTEWQIVGSVMSKAEYERIFQRRFVLKLFTTESD